MLSPYHCLQKIVTVYLECMKVEEGNYWWYTGDEYQIKYADTIQTVIITIFSVRVVKVLLSSNLSNLLNV